MKNYPHILSKVFREPWVVTREKHWAIQRILEARIVGQVVEDPLGMEDGDNEKPTMSKDGDTAIIPVHGIIGKHLSGLEMMSGGVDLDTVNTMLDMAAKDDGIESVILDFRSPGGTVTGVPETARKIANFPKGILAFTDSEMASGAYWLASQANGGIFATESSDVGSIGVYMALLDESRALENEGLKVNAISAGKFKMAGASFKPLTDDERKMFQDQVDSIYVQFKDAATRHRELSDDVMQGQVFDGQEAVTFGLVDGLVDDISELLS